MYQFPRGRPAAAMLLLSACMTVVAAAVAIDASRTTSTGVLIGSVVVTAVASCLAVLAFRVALALRHVEREASERSLAPVALTVREKR